MANNTINLMGDLNNELLNISGMFKAASDNISLINVSDIEPFPNHPFIVEDNADMEKLIDSISENGILTPLRLRSIPNGKYQLISGHRRLYAAKTIGITEVPALVKEMTDEEATIEMVDSNIQRENILPSEKAFAYKAKLEAIKKINKRGEKINGKSRSDEILATTSPDSAKTIQRYITLTRLIPALLNFVDEKKITFEAGLELSKLNSFKQDCIAEYINEHGKIKPSGIEAVMILEDSATQEEIISAISQAQASKAARKVEIPKTKLVKYFPETYTSQDIEKIIFELLDEWYEKNSR